MFGYIQDHEAEYWFEKINKWIDVLAKTNVVNTIDWPNANEKLTKTSSFQNVEKYNFFNFRKATGDTIQILHYFIRVVRQPNICYNSGMENERDKTIGSDDATFKRVPGARRETFQKMPVIPEEAYTKLHIRGRKPPELGVYDKLLISLQYLREYRTMEHIGIDYGVVQERGM